MNTIKHICILRIKFHADNPSYLHALMCIWKPFLSMLIRKKFIGIVRAHFYILKWKNDWRKYARKYLFVYRYCEMSSGIFCYQVTINVLYYFEIKNRWRFVFICYQVKINVLLAWMNEYMNEKYWMKN